MSLNIHNIVFRSPTSRGASERWDCNHIG